MPDDLLSQLPARPAGAHRSKVRCRGCRHWAYPENLIQGYGEDCAERLGLIPRRWRLRAAAEQQGADLFTTYPTETDMSSPDHTRPRVLVFLSETDLARLLRLPGGQYVAGVRDDFPRMGMQILVEGDGLAPVPLGTTPPEINNGRWWVPIDIRDKAPAEQHAAALEALDRVLLEERETVAGRSRIMNRHRPEDAGMTATAALANPGRGTRCRHCAATMDEMLVETGGARWPCVDFVDAAAGLWPEAPDVAV